MSSPSTVPWRSHFYVNEIFSLSTSMGVSFQRVHAGSKGGKIFRFDGYYYIIVFFSRVLLLVFGGVLYLLVLAVGDGFGCMALFVSLFLSNIFLLLPAKNKNTTVRNFLSLEK